MNCFTTKLPMSSSLIPYTQTTFFFINITSLIYFFPHLLQIYHKLSYLQMKQREEEKKHNKLNLKQRKWIEDARFCFWNFSFFP